MLKRIAILIPLIGLICTLRLPALAADGAAMPYSVTSTYKIGGAGGWDYATIDQKGELLYITRTDHMQVLNAHDGTVVADIAGVGRSHGVALVPDAHRGFISDGDGGRVVIFDLESHAVLGSVKAADDADGIIYDASTHLILVACGDAGVLVPMPADVDPKAGKSATPIDLGGKPEFLAVDGQGKAYINLEDKGSVAVVDLKTMKLIATWPLHGGSSPTGLSIDPESGRLFVGCRNQKMIVMSTKDGSILADLPIGRFVDATAFDKGIALASCADGTLTAVQETSGGKFEVTQVLQTPLGARTMAVNHSTGTIYLPTADMLPAATQNAIAGRPGRPKAIPGTFKIVVVERH